MLHFSELYQTGAVSLHQRLDYITWQLLRWFPIQIADHIVNVSVPCAFCLQTLCYDLQLNTLNNAVSLEIQYWASFFNNILTVFILLSLYGSIHSASISVVQSLAHTFIWIFGVIIWMFCTHLHKKQFCEHHIYTFCRWQLTKTSRTY